jgi:hypothetical protein
MLQSEFILAELSAGPTTRALSPSVYQSSSSRRLDGALGGWTLRLLAPAEAGPKVQDWTPTMLPASARPPAWFETSYRYQVLTLGSR